MNYISSTLPDSQKHDRRKEFKRLESAYAPSTLKSYFVDLTIYETWCVENGLRVFPADVSTVADFLTEQALTRKASTIRRRIYAISKAHRLLRLPNPTKDEEVNIAFRRIRRSNPARTRQAKGLTEDFRDRFMESRPKTPWGLRSRAMLALGYEILARRSELVTLRTEDVTFREDGTASNPTCV